jgi:hypothetical protein
MRKQTKGEVLRGNEVRTTLAVRGDTHGDYAYDAATAVQTLELWQSKAGWQGLDPTKKHALMMNAVKVSRILNGDPNHKDHWHDIAGYATLAEDRCE